MFTKFLIGLIVRAVKFHSPGILFKRNTKKKSVRSDQVRSGQVRSGQEVSIILVKFTMLSKLSDVLKVKLSQNGE
jgi:hypothetical protein